MFKNKIINIDKTSEKIIDSDKNISANSKADYYAKASKNNLKTAVKFINKSVKPAGNKEVNELVAKYKLKGISFGNWVSQNERLNFVTMLNKSLADLSKIMGFTNIGLNGTIGISYGDRGYGGSLAHFNAYTFVINLNKITGLQSLSHEYGHALDAFFHVYEFKSTGFLSAGGRDSETVARDFPKKSKTLYRLANLVVNQFIFDEKGELSVTYNRLLKNVANTSKGDYFIRRIEIFARCFESYMQTKIEKTKSRNIFLAKSKEKYNDFIYPIGNEKKLIIATMDMLISQFKNIIKK